MESSPIANSFDLGIRYKLMLGGLLGLSLLLLSPLLSFRSLDYSYRFEIESTARLTQQLHQEIAFYQRRIQQRPQDGLDRAILASGYLRLARATGNPQWLLLAQQTAQASLERLPFENPGAQLVLARVAEAQHDFTRAIQIAEKVRQQQPYNEEALTILASAALAQGKLAEADQLTQTLVEQTPTLGTYLQRALVLAARQQDTAAIAQFEAAIAAEEPREAGSSARARTLFAQFYLDQQQPHKAKPLLRAALKILPQYPPALIALAQLETQAGHYRRAEQLYQQVFVNPTAVTVYDHVALAGMAETAKLAGDRTTAEAIWQRAEDQLRQHPELKTFGHQRELAQLLLSRGRPADVAEALQLMQAEATNRRDAKTLETLAAALAAAGKPEAAQAILQELEANAQ